MDKAPEVLFELWNKRWKQRLVPEKTGSVAERSKALVSGTSHFGGVGSNPTTINQDIF